jgi:hypothetical protein
VKWPPPSFVSCLKCHHSRASRNRLIMRKRKAAEHSRCPVKRFGAVTAARSSPTFLRMGRGTPSMPSGEDRTCALIRNRECDMLNSREKDFPWKKAANDVRGSFLQQPLPDSFALSFLGGLTVLSRSKQNRDHCSRTHFRHFRSQQILNYAAYIT